MGLHPSFEHHGALVMLVPVLEVLSLGYDAIFFDVDISLLRDPIPFMVRGHVDVVMSPEIRVCHYPSRYPLLDWTTIQPNTGIMYIRHNAYTLNFYQDWMKEIVNNNVMNDQRVIDFHRFNAGKL